MVTPILRLSAGVVVHPENYQLNASQDFSVTDPSVPFINRIAEFKCPYIKGTKTSRHVKTLGSSSVYC